jgi:serine/threonine protein kinase
MAKTALERLAESVAADGWSLQPGERIGVYTILRRLGAGGAGEVWRARDERLGRDVAIKVLLPHFSSDPERLRRFADEARAAGALNHSNILTVYDVGEHGGIPFLVSECLEGQSLRQRIDAGPVRADEAVTIAIGIARGLAAAHARGIVHRISSRITRSSGRMAESRFSTSAWRSSSRRSKVSLLDHAAR